MSEKAKANDAKAQGWYQKYNPIVNKAESNEALNLTDCYSSGGDMKAHELKTDPDVFEASWNDLKVFEIRKDDRNFSPGDRLFLKETVYSGEEMKAGKPLEYTGRSIEQHVNYILHGPCYGLNEGWVIMSVESQEYQEPSDFIDEMADQAM